MLLCYCVESLNFSENILGNILTFEKNAALYRATIVWYSIEIAFGQKSLSKRRKRDNSLAKVAGSIFETVVFDGAVKNAVTVLVDDKRRVELLQIKKVCRLCANLV